MCCKISWKICDFQLNFFNYLQMQLGNARKSQGVQTNNGTVTESDVEVNFVFFANALKVMFCLSVY